VDGQQSEGGEAVLPLMDKSSMETCVESTKVTSTYHTVPVPLLHWLSIALAALTLSQRHACRMVSPPCSNRGVEWLN
jgi:hypothetical protein